MSARFKLDTYKALAAQAEQEGISINAALDEAVSVWVHGRKQAAVMTPDPPPTTRPQRCKHPRAARKFVGFGTKCELCGALVST